MGPFVPVKNLDVIFSKLQPAKTEKTKKENRKLNPQRQPLPIHTRIVFPAHNAPYRSFHDHHSIIQHALRNARNSAHLKKAVYGYMKQIPQQKTLKSNRLPSIPRYYVMHKTPAGNMTALPKLLNETGVYSTPQHYMQKKIQHIHVTDRLNSTSHLPTAASRLPTAALPTGRERARTPCTGG